MAVFRGVFRNDASSNPNSFNTPCQQVFYFIAIEGFVSAPYICSSFVAAVSARVLFRVGKVAKETSLNFSVSDHVKLFARRRTD
jgi:hypothetical protein